MAYREVGGEVGQYPKQVVWFYLFVVLAQAETDLFICLLHLLKALCHPRHLQRRRRVEPLRDSTIRRNKVCLLGEMGFFKVLTFWSSAKGMLLLFKVIWHSQVDSYKLSLPDYYPPELRRGKYWGVRVFLLQYFPLVKI